MRLGWLAALARALAGDSGGSDEYYCVRVKTWDEDENDGTITVTVNGVVVAGPGPYALDTVVFEHCFVEQPKVELSNPTDDAWAGAVEWSTSGTIQWGYTPFDCPACTTGIAWKDGAPRFAPFVVDGDYNGLDMSPRCCLNGNTCEFTWPATPVPTPPPTPWGVCVPVDGIDFGECEPTEAGYADVDMDRIPNANVSLRLSTKPSHTDDHHNFHGATVGSIVYEEEHGRYFMKDKQTKGEKTIKITVTRPAELTAFGAEWVKAFPRSSFHNITNEYEPYTINAFGSKIPLTEFRPVSSQWVDDAQNSSEMNVFMEMSGEGDFQFKYGNPYLQTDQGKWISLEFGYSQLRIGSPYSKCNADASGASVGTIVPLYLGDPSLDYYDFQAAADLIKSSFVGWAADLCTKVVLSIFTPWVTTEPWTVSGNQAENGYTQCYPAGRACPLNHGNCDPKYCKIDRWNEIIAFIRDESNLGNIQVLGLLETKNEDGTPRTAQEISKDIMDYQSLTPVDGFYFNQAHGGKDRAKSVVMDLLAINAGLVDSYFTVFGFGEPLFENAEFLSAPGAPDVWVTLDADVDSLGVWTPFSWFSEANAASFGAVVTSVPESRVRATAKTLFDRGYGYLYIHSEPELNVSSTHLPKFFRELGGLVSTMRQLSETDTAGPGVPALKYACDDTLFSCEPVCMETLGLVTTLVPDAKCSSLPRPDPCSCRCYYDAVWVCQGGVVACQASVTGGGAPQVVGDLVCEGRGTPKPTWRPEERVAGACEPIRTARGLRPAPECLQRLERENPGYATPAHLVERVDPPSEPENLNMGVEQLRSDFTILSAAHAASVLAIALLLHRG
jgi:hypothetical protein